MLKIQGKLQSKIETKLFFNVSICGVNTVWKKKKYINHV